MAERAETSMNELDRFENDSILKMLEGMCELRRAILNEQNKLQRQHEELEKEHALLEEKCKKLEHDAAEMHRAVNHKRGYQTIQSFSRTHNLELSREEAQKYGLSLWWRLKKSGRLGEINKTDELTVGAKNDKVNEYSVDCLTEYFHDIGLI